MQFHYVVGYDTKMKKWFVEYDTTAYFADGNMWDEEKSDSSDFAYMGWGVPEDNSPEAAFDMELLRTLESVRDTFPIHD